MNLPAIALYALGAPLAIVVGISSFEETNAKRELLGLPMRLPSINDKIALAAAAVLWPFLGLFCWVLLFVPKRSRP